MPRIALLLLLLFPFLAAAETRVGYLPIHGPIDDGRAAFFKRALAEAKTKQLTQVVVHLTTDGGALSAGQAMLQQALTADGPRLIAFIDNRCYSAGSLIAYGHHEILLSKEATLGDIGVIKMSADGQMEYAPEKVETVVRTLLRSAAQNRGWDEATLVKMTARNQELYRIDLPEGPKMVLEDGLPAFLAAHPQVKPESKVLILGKDRLLSYTAQEAIRAGMATALVEGLDGVYARLGVAKANVVDLSPTSTEQWSWTLAGFAPLLAAAALAFLFLEFKSPGFGWWGGLAIACGVGFFVCQFALDLAGYIEVVLLLVGIALVIVEFLVLPTMGLVGALGGLLIALALILSFMPTAQQFDPSAPFWAERATRALGQALLALAVLTAGAVALLLALPKLAVRSRLADAAAIEGTSAGTVEAAGLTGRIGMAVSDLTPGGEVEVDGARYSASADHGRFIATGTPITVVEARFGELVVRPS
jgi:membrane-bound serine protease (ClpP class)